MIPVTGMIPIFMPVFTRSYEDKFVNLEKKIDKMEQNIEKLLENQAQQKGAGWLAIGMLSVLSTLGGWLMHWWLK